MTGTALHTNEIFQYLVLDKIVIAFTAKIPYSVCVISTWISVINMRICNVLLNFFVSVYLSHLGFANVLLLRQLTLNYTLHQFMIPFPDLTFYRL